MLVVEGKQADGEWCWGAVGGGPPFHLGIVKPTDSLKVGAWTRRTFVEPAVIQGATSQFMP